VEEIDGIPVDLALLPAALLELRPLIRKFAIGDDAVRDSEMQSAPISELEALARLTGAQWDAINAFLDEHMEETGTPQQDVALVLSAFAEAAAEAPLDLDRRSNQ
jgi:hypothetical protein